MLNNLKICLIQNITNNFPLDKCNEILQTNDQLKECNRLGVIKLSDFIQACHIDYQVPWEISYNLQRYILLVFFIKGNKIRHLADNLFGRAQV